MQEFAIECSGLFGLGRADLRFSVPPVSSSQFTLPRRCLQVSARIVGVCRGVLLVDLSGAFVHHGGLLVEPRRIAVCLLGAIMRELGSAPGLRGVFSRHRFPEGQFGTPQTCFFPPLFHDLTSPRSAQWVLHTISLRGTPDDSISKCHRRFTPHPESATLASLSV